MFPRTLDLFKIGVGPSSSHTVGPMIAARNFAVALDAAGLLPRVTRVRTELFGSLGATGYGHGTHLAILSGLAGQDPATARREDAVELWRRVRRDRTFDLLGTTGAAHPVTMDTADDLVLDGDRSLPYHPNAMTFTAWAGEDEVARDTWYSTGGGFVVQDDGTGRPVVTGTAQLDLPYRYRRADDLLALCHRHELSPAGVMWANELVDRDADTAAEQILGVWQVMQDSIDQGLATGGVLPGGLFVARRAARLREVLDRRGADDPLSAIDWLTCWAMAVNEQNAAGGRVVTAPTNGASGVIPAVGRYCLRYVPGFDDRAKVRFLLTAAAVGAIFQGSGSISGAEVGCQGEVGTACAMAAAALCHTLGGTAQQVLNAAEIGLEHNLGLTCDPVAGLVQVPCIERNGMGAVKAITAARMALADDGYQFVTLDECVRTMMSTGLDMADKYKETSRGGLAVSIANC